MPRKKELSDSSLYLPKRVNSYDVAGPAGIEPVTDGFFRPQRDLRVRCSALLSYGPAAFLLKKGLQ
jgi:hypothetical protein